MSTLFKIRSFFSRHKNKFFIGGLLVTSTLLLSKYMQKRLRDWHEKEAREFLERNRKQSHFESINQTCNQTILGLSSSLLDTIYAEVDTDSIIESLKSNSVNKFEKWNTLKVQVFTKAACVIYGLVMLVMTLKIQLNILGGYLYRNTMDVSTQQQEQYLSLWQNFLNVGVKKLTNTIETEVEKILERVDLKKQMKLSDLEAIFWSLQSSLASHKESPIEQIRPYVINDELSSNTDVYHNMLRDTADLLESDEVKLIVTHYVSKGFYVLGDQLSEFFGQNESKLSELRDEKVDIDTFLNPFSSKKPMAKLIPILNGLLSKQSFPQNFTQILITDEKINTLGANVYESLLF
ncbi:peroxisomal biogenesis factor 3 [Cylas formicarius]|uniref:peroxisomal biogenesis factor 3 n=1 Tax=Cylas formicarius TaxID=197179 RepID=UPI0029589F2B|nr:peroxisomal biogenesis factor 3 [Cylas formicarius]